MEKVPDRRVRRTRQSLHSALVSLILSKGYDAVTVQDIIDEADVGRSTFYGHFSGKEALLRFGFERLRAELAAAPPDLEDGAGAAAALAFSLPMLRHAQAHAPLYRAMIGGRGGVIARREVRRIVAERIGAGLDLAGNAGRLPRPHVVAFLAGAFLGVLEGWLERDRAAAPEEIDLVFRQLALAGLVAPDS